MTINEMKERIHSNYTEMYDMYYNGDNIVPLITEGRKDALPEKELVAN